MLTVVNLEEVRNLAGRDLGFSMNDKIHRGPISSLVKTKDGYLFTLKWVAKRTNTRWELDTSGNDCFLVPFASVNRFVCEGDPEKNQIKIEGTSDYFLIRNPGDLLTIAKVF